jgi:hypothetical protein
MEHIFVNSGHISLIVSDLERYDAGLLEYKINLRNIHGISTQGVMIPDTLFPSIFIT